MEQGNQHSYIPWEDDDDDLGGMISHCKGKGCDKDTTDDDTVIERFDAYGYSTG